MNTPRTIAEYLSQLRQALKGADPALIQDALYDAEEHLRAELADKPHRGEAEMLAQVAGSYGAPEEVAELYRDQEIKIQRALRPPPSRSGRTPFGRFFSVAADPYTYGSLFYLLLALVTGVFYFAWVVTGLALSSGLAVLIVGIPFIILFFGSVRLVSLVEGRLVETMLGVRMPRRPRLTVEVSLPLKQRIAAMFADRRTWSTILYMLLLLPLGTAYFSLTAILLSVSLGLVAAPGFKAWMQVTHQGLGHCEGQPDWFCGLAAWVASWGGAITLCFLGIYLLFLSLHLLRALGKGHGHLAKHLLVTRYA